MNLNPAFTLCRIWPVILAGAFLAGGVSGFAGDHPKFESLVVWATNDEKQPDDKKQSDDKKLKPVDKETREKLESLGLKWKHFYEVKRVKFDAPKGESGKVAVSEKSSISVKVLEDKKVEVVFYGKKGEECTRRIQTLKPGDMLVHGGSVPENSTAWLVTLKQLK